MYSIHVSCVLLLTFSLLSLILFSFCHCRKDNGRQLKFTTPSYADTLRVHESIQTYAFPGRRNLGYLFAFESKRSNVMGSIVVDNSSGKKAITLPPTPRRFDGVGEFARQFGGMQPCPWTLYTQINATYQLSMSYPSILAGPSSLPEASQETQRVLRQCATFRSEQRLTALTWSSGVDGASLWRASQPKVGLQGNRNPADEFYLRHIAESAASSNSLRLDARPKPSKEWIQKITGQPDMGLTVDPGTTLKILDMRPRASAMANRTSGYGYENTSHYVGTTMQFCNIANIHAVRDAYQKMSAHCMSPTTQDQNWNSLIEDTKWLHHIRQIWAASWEAAFWIHVHRLPVLIHCSHGWDRTSQVAALAQLLLDPYYRTRAGFACLIEKDFLSFGHPFHTRCAHGEGRGGEAPSSGSSDEGQISPIFMQFLDCVYQLIKLYPEKFEFNETYLLVLSEHVYSCRFGTLLCDTERERELVAGIRQRTHSVWDYLESRPDCVNQGDSYKPSAKVLLMPLPTLLRGISLWTDRHAMYGPKVTSRSPVSPLDLVPAKETEDKTSVPADSTSSTPPPPEESTPATTETES
jgi:myotubularin-related protein 1/2